LNVGAYGHTPLPLYFQAPYDAFLVRLKASIFAGLFVSSPVFFLEFWLFLSPAFSRSYIVFFFPLVLACVFLFLAVSCFAFWGLLPVGLRFLLGFQTASLQPLLSAGSYFSFLIGMVLASGITFDLPVLVLGLVRVGLLDAAGLRAGRKGAAVVILVLTAVLTPSPDPIGQVLLALPLILLYEGTIWIAARMEKTKS
jgi:sec-independent protein translocase protein TatC